MTHGAQGPERPDARDGSGLVDVGRLGSGPVRLARAAVVSLVTVWVAVTCHLLAGGMRPPLWALVGVQLVVAGVAFVLSRSQWSLLRLSALMLLVEAGVHLLCAWLSPMTMSHTANVEMLGWHLVGALVSVALLRRGEQVLWALVETLTLRGMRILAAVSGPLAESWTGNARTSDGLRGRSDFAAAVIRGPPA